MEIVILALVTAWVLFAATLWVIRILAEEAWAAIKRQPSPRIERRRAREELARECGVPTIGQALSFRIANRVANPPERRLLAEIRAYLDTVIQDGLEEARVRHQYAHEERVRARKARQRPPRGRHRPQQGQGWQATTGGPAPADDPGPDRPTVAWEPCTRCGLTFVAPPETVCDTCTTVTGHAPPHPDGPWVAASRRHGNAPWPVCSTCGLVMLVWPRLDVSYDEGDAAAQVEVWCPTCTVSSSYSWQLTDAEFEAEFGYPFGDDPDDPDPQPAAADTDREQQHTNGEAPTMTAITHTIHADVRDPRTALAFAAACRGFNDGMTSELEILHNNLRGQGLGPNALQQIVILADATRTYSISNIRSVTTYAQHVVTQRDIHADEDLRATVRRTYLDTNGSDAAAPAPAGTTTRSFYATDVRHPAAAARYMTAVAGAYNDLKASVDLTKNNHIMQGVSGPPIAFLDEQLTYATIVAARAVTAARTFWEHVQRIQDTIGKDPSLRGTQNGTYADPTKV